MNIRVAIADDHAILRQGLAQLLQNADGITLVAETSDGDQLLEAVGDLQPDVAISDVSMPTLGAQQVAEHLLRDGSPTRVIALTVHESPEIVEPILAAGVAGYVLKKNAFDDLLSAIRTVYEGGTFVSATVAGSLLTSPAAQTSIQPTLTARERDVLIGVASGTPYKRLARQLDISVRTVETYRERLLKKLELATTADLIRYAVKHDMLDG